MKEEIYFNKLPSIPQYFTHSLLWTTLSKALLKSMTFSAWAPVTHVTEQVQT